MRFWEDERTTLYQGDARQVLWELPAGSVQCVVTSPPYLGLRDYGVPGQIGQEPSVEGYVTAIRETFLVMRRVLRDDGTVWLNLGDGHAGSGQGRNGDGSVGKLQEKQRSNRGTAQGVVPGKRVERGTGSGRWGLGDNGFPGLKAKDLLGVPWAVAFALRADGWYLRADVIWDKPNVFPESVRDRPTISHEYLFLLSKSRTYYYDADAIKEPHSPDGRRDTVFKGAPSYEGVRADMTDAHERWPNGGRNKRSVWTIPNQPLNGVHFAVFPEALVRPCILAGSREGDTVLDPFSGSGTVGVVARKAGRKSVLIDLSPEYCELARDRFRQAVLL